MRIDKQQNIIYWRERTGSLRNNSMIPSRYRFLLWEILFIMIWPSEDGGWQTILIITHIKAADISRLLQKQNFIGSIYIFIGMLGHRLPASSVNVSDFEFSDVYFIIWFYVCSIWLHITIGKTLRSRILRRSVCKWVTYTYGNRLLFSFLLIQNVLRNAEACSSYTLN